MCGKRHVFLPKASKSRVPLGDSRLMVWYGTYRSAGWPVIAACVVEAHHPGVRHGKGWDLEVRVARF